MSRRPPHQFRRRERPEREGAAPSGRAAGSTVWLFGHHAVAAALANPRRTVRRILATKNALDRLGAGVLARHAAPQEIAPRDLDKLLGEGVVHQGIAIEAEPLPALDVADLAGSDLVVVLDQVTDPHNVGAIMRTAAAFAAGGVVTTARHAPDETGVLAKAASGALDIVPLVAVANLARALGDLADLGFFRIGLDSEAAERLAPSAAGGKTALVLGAEGKGLRRLTRDTCDATARLDLPGRISSLNVSNAAALALYVVHSGR
ncbi:MAG: RNA methyltransferase [Bauldia sp.]